MRLLTLDRPPANALEETLLTDLDAALEAARADDRVRAVVLTGAGTFFSGGFDLAAPRRNDAETHRMQALYRDSHLRLLGMPKPTVALMNGHAIAGGLVLVLACDYRLGVGGEYRVGLNEVAIGSSFPRVAFEIVRLRLSHARASALLLGASLHPAGRAVELGIIDELLPEATAVETTMQRPARLAAFPREAYAHTKHALVAEAVAHVEAETDETAAHSAAVWTSAESRAARAAQQAKLRLR